MMIVLPWPPAELFPNRKNGRHWGSTSDLKGWYRLQCKTIALMHKPKSFENICLELVFTPPVKKGRAPDLDNSLAAIKSGLDGVAQAWGIDDSIFNRMVIEKKPPEGSGQVLLTVTRGIDETSDCKTTGSKELQNSNAQA